ncbi:MAG: GNAT family N-acetyltransferase [Candidatus Izemoplasmatales bacterium]
MGLKVINFPNKKDFVPEYYEIRDFLIKLKDTEYTFSRWDWMITHSMTKAEDLSKIGIWKDDSEVVGLVIFDIIPDTVFIRTLDNYEYLKAEMLEYAKKHYIYENSLSIQIQDDDYELQSLAAKEGLLATGEKEATSVLYTEETSVDYDLPKQFKVVTLKEAPSPYQYFRLFWRGFNHELKGEGPYKHSDEKEEEGKQAIHRPNNNLEHKIIIQNEAGDHVAFCGLWYDESLDYAVVEPLATDPDYRRLGLAQAAMFEGIQRVKKAGAKRIVVNTDKQFYYNRGFRPFKTQTIWKKTIL